MPGKGLVVLVEPGVHGGPGAHQEGGQQGLVVRQGHGLALRGASHEQRHGEIEHLWNMVIGEGGSGGAERQSERTWIASKIENKQGVCVQLVHALTCDLEAWKLLLYIMVCEQYRLQEGKDIGEGEG